MKASELWVLSMGSDYAESDWISIAANKWAESIIVVSTSIKNIDNCQMLFNMKEKDDCWTVFSQLNRMFERAKMKYLLSIFHSIWTWTID